MRRVERGALRCDDVVVRRGVREWCAGREKGGGKKERRAEKGQQKRGLRGSLIKYAHAISNAVLWRAMPVLGWGAWTKKKGRRRENGRRKKWCVPADLRRWIAALYLCYCARSFWRVFGGADGEGRGAMGGPGIQGVGGLGRGGHLAWHAGAKIQRRTHQRNIACRAALYFCPRMPGCLGRGSSSFLGSRELLGWPNHGGNGPSPKLAWLGMARLARLHSTSVPPIGTCAGGNGACFLPAALVWSPLGG